MHIPSSTENINPVPLSSVKPKVCEHPNIFAVTVPIPMLYFLYSMGDHPPNFPPLVA